MFKKAVLELLREAYVGPVDPGRTWFASNAAGAGVLGTLEQVGWDAAFRKPAGVSRPIAEHVSHLTFALETALRFAQGDMTQRDWKESWKAGEASAARWAELQAGLRTAYERLAGFAEKETRWEPYELVAGFMGQIAHGAYHLGAIRQLTQSAGVKLAGEQGGAQAG